MAFNFSMRIKEKLIASMVHFVCSVPFAVLGAWVVFFVWYPSGLSEVAKGAQLYWLVLLVDITLGPALSIVIYSSLKHRRELIRDYSIVVAIQVSALLYGLYVIAASRPVYIVFVKDSFELMTATQFSKKDLGEAAKTSFGRLPWFGPELVCARSPNAESEKSMLMFSALDGKDIQFFPKYYQYCGPSDFIPLAYGREMLEDIASVKGYKLDIPEQNYVWLPFNTRFGQGVEIYPNRSYEEKILLDFNPYLD